MTLNPQNELFERARKTIRELREKLRAAEAANRPEPIAVIGMGIRFPGCGSDVQQFWRMIVDGRDAVKGIPPDRWNRDAYYAYEAGVPGKINTRHAAFLDDVRRFDAAFFDITPREAIHMDPQQRIFLETAWHALEDAGLPKALLAGSDTGVFVGVHSHSIDYQMMQFENLAALDAYSATGTAHDMIAGRLAYWLDLHGPAVAVNTACSSSLLAAHLACESLRAGDCSVALAGGVNLLLAPGFTVAAAQLQLLSPDGRCKPFDARGDGMGRGEGCGVVVLKRLDAALRDGDRVLAVVRGSAVNQDGRTNGLTAPNGLSQRRVLARALKNASVKPREIGYVEAHGTGTSLGDPIEVEALSEVLGEGGRRDTPCTLGAVKANIGHLEGAAGIAGLIKTVLVLSNRWLPAVTNLKELNPHLAIDGTVLSIPHQGRKWTAERRLAGVSSFGWSGTNVHMVLEEAPAWSEPIASKQTWPLVISAQSPDALRILASAYADRLEQAEDTELVNICFTSAVRRTHHAHRMAVSGSQGKKLGSELRRRIAEWTEAQTSRQPLETCDNSGNGSRDLEQTIRAWEAGADVDWSFAFANRGSIVDLPYYPFQGTQYWLSSAASVPGENADLLPTDWLYSIEWREKPLSPLPPDQPSQPITWLLFHSGEHFGESLAEAGRQRGDTVIERRIGEDFSQQTPDAAVSGKGFAESLNHLFAELTEAGTRPQHAVYLAGPQSVTETVTIVMELAQAVIGNGAPLKLWFVTQSTKTNEEPEAAFHSSQTAIRGFSRVLGLEHPEYSGGVIEVDEDSVANASAVRDEITRATGEDRISLRKGSRFVARLRRDNPQVNAEPLKLKADRSYLITGAFGRLGMEIASWLVLNGARHLVLVGRRDPFEIGSHELTSQLEDWREQGITLIAEACDVSDELQVSKVLARIEGGRSLAGVIHAAAGIRFGSIVNASRQDVELAFRAKVEGARVLDRCTRQSDLDFFVLFGSAAATIGLRDGSLYAAANGCLDSIVIDRRSSGLPALCVEWGSWQSPRDERPELVERSGFVAMKPRKALDLLGALIASRRRSSLVADIDWSTLGPALELRGGQALVADLIPSSISQLEQTALRTIPTWLDELRELPIQERKHRLLDLVGGGVRKVFGMTSEDPLDESRGLFQSGMDSLMSVRLKRALEARTGLRLPGTLTFTYPTIEAIATYLEESLFPSPVAGKGREMPSLQSEKKDEFSTSVAEMNESETNAAIAAELAAIQQKLGAF
jgi:acyl transferase domain-containing protein/acyl carrier protein